MQAPPPHPPAIVVPAGLSSALLARTPLVQDPVSFCIGDDGSIYVAERFRQEKGVEDNHSSKFWLEDDLQLRTVDDRLRMYEKWAAKREGGMDYYRRHVDRVMRLVDADGDGVPDRATEFSGDMNEPLDGTGAGVMWLDGANQRGPWSQERTWWTWDAADRGRPAWTLPPIVNCRSAAAWLRCHMVEGTGGHAAPSLAGAAGWSPAWLIRTRRWPRGLAPSA